MLSLHEEIQFRDPVRARPELIYLGKLSPAAARSVSALLPSLPNPDDAVHFLNRLIAERPDAARQITDDPAALRYALTIFSYSRFLADSVIRYPQWLLEIALARDLHRGFLAEQYEELLARSLPSGRRSHVRSISHSSAAATAADRAARCPAFRRSLRNHRGSFQSRRRHSECHLACSSPSAFALERGEQSGTGGQFSVIALGKLGGRELNYSSDIDLMFVYSGDGADSGEFFKIAANRMTDMLSTYTSEGMCYRVDLRLRPDGRFGEVCHSLEGAKQYYASRGRDWELQMLIKARVAAGDPGPGRDLLEFVEPLIYRTTTDFRTMEAVSETRARIHEKLHLEKQRHAKPTGADVKLARGGIRDIEFLVQCLQRLHGGREPWVRHGGTLLALSRLRDKELLSPLEYARLASAYQFMRHLEHRLQFDEDRQTHTLPQGQRPARSARAQNAAGLALACRAPALWSANSTIISPACRTLRSRDPFPARLAAGSWFRKTAESGRIDAEFPSGNLSRYLDLRAPAFSQLIAKAG